MSDSPRKTAENLSDVKHWISSTIAEISRAPAYAATRHMTFNNSSHATVSTDPRANEIGRQIDRIKPYLKWLAQDDNTGVDKESLNSSIAFLNTFITGPTSIPMLSVSNDGKATAFLKEHGVSLEAFFDRNKIEYLFTPDDSDEFVFGEGELLDGKIPTNLIYLLYANFAKNKQSTAE